EIAGVVDRLRALDEGWSEWALGTVAQAHGDRPESARHFLQAVRLGRDKAGTALAEIFAELGLREEAFRAGGVGNVQVLWALGDRRPAPGPPAGGAGGIRWARRGGGSATGGKPGDLQRPTDEPGPTHHAPLGTPTRLPGCTPYPRCHFGQSAATGASDAMWARPRFAQLAAGSRDLHPHDDGPRRARTVP